MISCAPHSARRALVLAAAAVAIAAGWLGPSAAEPAPQGPPAVEARLEAPVAPAPEPATPAAPPAALGRAGYRALIERESARAGLPAEIAEAVLAVESGYNPGARGGAGEIGLMQVLPSTARMLGFAGTDDQLADPATNIRYGVTYLAGAWRRGGQDICTATMKYRAGHGETRFSQLSVSYCLAVRGKLAARGYAVTGSVPAATFGFASAGASTGFAGRSAKRLGGGCRGVCLKGSGDSGADVASLNERLASIAISVKVVKIPGR